MNNNDNITDIKGKKDVLGPHSNSTSTCQFPSTRMGIITSIYDVAALIFTGPVSYFGVRKKPVTLGIGMITMGIGYLVFISPHFTAEEYIPGKKLTTLLLNPLILKGTQGRHG